MPYASTFANNPDGYYATRKWYFYIITSATEVDDHNVVDGELSFEPKLFQYDYSQMTDYSYNESVTYDTYFSWVFLGGYNYLGHDYRVVPGYIIEKKYEEDPDNRLYASDEIMQSGELAVLYNSEAIIPYVFSDTVEYSPNYGEYSAGSAGIVYTATVASYNANEEESLEALFSTDIGTEDTEDDEDESMSLAEAAMARAIADLASDASTFDTALAYMVSKGYDAVMDITVAAVGNLSNPVFNFQKTKSPPLKQQQLSLFANEDTTTTNISIEATSTSVYEEGE